ncbi:MAG: sigma-70 family RNA polymerase sigma factor, partial [Propionibacteriaceae bacterium]|nr:sigma-70 family RNA polymerase sigma factor [Propionibacteriaceae bacterium]
SRQLEDVWRRESPHVLGALLRRHADLGDCEDAAQEAVEAAARQWPREGVPENPRGWLIRVASRRLIDQTRSERARAVREEAVAVAQPNDAFITPGVDTEQERAADDSLQLLLLCCHPSLTRRSQVALTLRAVSGLSTPQIAAAFLVPEATMAQRLSRAKATLHAREARFELPEASALPERVAAVLDVLYLVFNEGYMRSAGHSLVDTSLTQEAIRLTRQLHRHLPDHDEVAGALALMMLTQARQAARVDDRGDLIPLSEQDRQLWDKELIAEGVGILELALPRGHVGRFQLQAASAAVHAESPTWQDTDWRQISLLYEMLERTAPSPAVTLNQAVAVSMSLGPQHGLTIIDNLLTDPTMRRHHRTHAVRGHLLETAGDLAGAADEYSRAAQLTASLPEQRYLNARAQRARCHNEARKSAPEDATPRDLGGLTPDSR